MGLKLELGEFFEVERSCKKIHSKYFSFVPFCYKSCGSHPKRKSLSERELSMRGYPKDQEKKKKVYLDYQFLKACLFHLRTHKPHKKILNL